MRTGKDLLIACGALAHELVSLKKRYCWDSLDIQCLPAELHNTPQKITPRIRELLDKLLPSYERCYIAYADCGTGGQLDTLIDEFGIERLPGAHCYEFYAGSESFEKLADEEPGTFFLTDFLVLHFDRIIMRGLGIDKHPELLEMYFGNYRKLVFLDQSGDKTLQDLALQAAVTLGLHYEYRFTGLQNMAAPIELFFRPPTSSKVG